MGLIILAKNNLANLLAFFFVFIKFSEALALPRETHLLAIQSPVVFTTEESNEFYLSNTANEPKNRRFTVDTESAGIQGNYQFDNVKIGYDFFYLSNGILDEGIRRWHDMLSLPQGGRRRIKDDKLDLSFGPNNIQLSEGFNLGRTSIGSEIILNESKNQPDFIFNYGVALPGIGSAMLKSGIDIYSSVVYKLNFYSQQISIETSFLKLGDTAGAGLRFHDYRGGLNIDLESPVSEKVTFCTSLKITSAVLKQPDIFPDYSILLDLSLKFSGLRVGLRENPAPAAGTEDIVFFIGFD